MPAPSTRWSILRARPALAPSLPRARGSAPAPLSDLGDPLDEVGAEGLVTAAAAAAVGRSTPHAPAAAGASGGSHKRAGAKAADSDRGSRGTEKLEQLRCDNLHVNRVGHAV